MNSSKLRLAAAVFLVGFALGLSVFGATRLFVRSMLAHDAIVAAEQLAKQLASGSVPAPGSLFPVTRYVHVDVNGTMVASAAISDLDAGARLQAMAGQASAGPAVSQPGLLPSIFGFADLAVQAVAVPVVENGRQVGTVSASVDQSTSVDALTRKFSTAAMVIVALVGLAVALVGAVFTRNRMRGAAARPLDSARIPRDPVTGLLNRSGFDQALADSVRRATRSDGQIALMIVKITGLRPVNDVWGHSAGDAVLKLAAERLKPFGRPAATVSRISGASFALILEGDVNSHSLRSLGREVIATLSAPYDFEGANIALGASIGVALFPVNAETAESLFRAADVAVSKAMQEGRQGLRFFDTEMSKLMKRRTALERDLRRALEGEEFVVFYQPQLDLASGKLRGHEALVRWERPGEGIVSPADFLAVAEETGLIRPLGEWVLRRACRDAATWLDAGTVAVNFSAAQFASGDLDKTVAAVLAETGLPPQRLEIEVPESLVLEHARDVMDMLGRIKNLGVKIAMDDFGTGYSSLASLARFPFDKIKIDRSFVAQLAEDPEVAAIIASIVGLGRSLSVDITAEGVETQEQVTLLQAAGCSTVQGFLFGAPQRARAQDQDQRVRAEGAA
jgi:diguanylate cyclase (GGDEF)-like protein